LAKRFKVLYAAGYFGMGQKFFGILPNSITLVGEIGIKVK
jgi:hypothetical protein